LASLLLGVETTSEGEEEEEEEEEEVDVTPSSVGGAKIRSMKKSYPKFNSEKI